ncbi:T9SS type B sorting domain-containing protein [Flavobacterium sp. CYK-4]|uniref:T9SS type B sorting domain-containing protein n=1 Tax=Flavobacterium lotistagni TaxID=2709660 RepID=UPI00140E37B7|nr:T9SS type B sorting domain-containing protein [Flavobacterium lotistagni]NHM05836.1 T9SS type B sorting domain-containing protein [Flavobacterium lotistagni]
MRITLIFFFFSLILHGQTVNDTIDLKSSKSIYKHKQLTNPNSNYTFCDDDSDGLIPFDISQINTDILNENSTQIGFQSGIYICTSWSNVYLVDNVSTSPQINLVCHVTLGGFGTTDIATNLSHELFVSKENRIYKIDGVTCQVLETYDYNIYDDYTITSLSFDTSNNMYYGGYNSSVYRSSGDYSASELWHDFGSGSAAGDFVICNGKMYIAWKLNGICRLYQVTIDSNNNYISHVDLGELPNPTYGLASELGKLYGVNPDFLYEISLNPLNFNTILTNTSTENWYGSAGKNEGISFSVSAFETLSNAQNNVNPLSSTWSNTVPGGQTIYVVIKNLITNQSQTIPVDLIVNFPPTYVIPEPIIHCLNELNPQLFDLRSTENLITGNQSNLVVSYHNSITDAQNNSNPLPDQYTLVGNNMDVYVRVNNTLTGCSSYFSFKIIVNQVPVFTQPNALISCTRSNPIHSEVALENQANVILTGLDPDHYAVLFYHSNQDAVLKTNPISIPYFTALNQEEIFFNVLDLQTGCSSVGSFINNVYEENQNFVESVHIETFDWTPNQNAISVAVLGNDIYEYSLDGISYVSDGLFENLIPGIYDVYVRNVLNCGIFSKEIYLLNFPVFFTPNNDGYNDYWNVNFSNYEADIKIYIYDRFGMLITEVNPKSVGWDGSLNNKQLPSSDYWFLIKRKDKNEYRGHFTLKR